MTYGFEGDPHILLTTAQTAARLGYALTPDGKPTRTWYNEAGKRKATGFPAPVRRGLYRLGDLQAWAARRNAGKVDHRPAAIEREAPSPSHANLNQTVPRPEILQRLAVIRGGR